MAKSNSIFDFQGTVHNVTHVNSKAYGKHVRAPRGTHKPAVINEAFKRSGKELVNANLTAKMIKDALNPYLEGFRDGTLWHRLLSVIKREHVQQPVNFNVLEGFELYKTNPLDRYMKPVAAYQVDHGNHTLRVAIRYNFHPDFKRYKRIDGYCLKLIALFPNIEEKTVATNTHSFPVISLSDPVREVNVTLTVPTPSDTVLFCLRLDGCIQGQPVSNLRTKGMAFMSGRSQEPGLRSKDSGSS